MKNSNNLLIVLVALLLLSNMFFGYMFFFHKPKPDFQGRMPQIQLSDDEINAIESFFNSNPSAEEITDYCNNNRMNCAYYCMNIDQNNDFCSQMMQQRPGFQPGTTPSGSSDVINLG